MIFLSFAVVVTPAAAATYLDAPVVAEHVGFLMKCIARDVYGSREFLLQKSH